jgi:hypothetical protein
MNFWKETFQTSTIERPKIMATHSPVIPSLTVAVMPDKTAESLGILSTTEEQYGLK